MGSSASSKWGSAGWWFLLTISVPFSVYTWPFAVNNFDTYKKVTLNWISKNYDIAGLHVRDHHIAWQIHSVFALAFMMTGLFQFSASFRRAYPKIHRRIGYMYSSAAIVRATTGIVFLNPHTEFGTMGRTVFFLMAVDLLVCVCIAVQAARQKNFKLHQRYMIRAAAVGYSFIAVRFWIGVLLRSGVYIWKATEWGAFLAPVSFIIPAEIYIRSGLSGGKKRA